MKSKIKLCLTLLLLLLLFVTLASCELSEFVKWTSLRYKSLTNSMDSTVYDSYVNVPFGISHYKNKLFLTVPRRNPGIPSTLNIIELNGNPPHINPLLVPYPSYKMNSLSPSVRADPAKIVSVYRSRVDRCDRLWFVDTGVLEYTGNQINVQRPSIWTIDLNSHQVIRRFEIPEGVASDGKGLASITVDDDSCSNSFAYIPDWLNNALVVYSLHDQRAWRFDHNYFHFNPFEGDFFVDGLQFQWTDGIFSIALSSTRTDGYRTAFFHPMASRGEFTVSTEVLRNEALAGRRTHGNDFKFLGQRGPDSQSGNHHFDLNTKVMFFTEMQKNAVSCWNIKEPLKGSNIDIIAQNNSTMIYPVDLTIDNESTLWVLSNRLPRFIYDRYNTSAFNFNIFKSDVHAALAGTFCYP